MPSSGTIIGRDFERSGERTGNHFLATGAAHRGTVTGTNSHRGSGVAAVLIRVNGLARREYVLQHSPLSAVHELCSGFAEPLCYAHREGHICHPCGAQVCQSAGRAVDLPCESDPSEA
jgi:hypothetical protein